MNIVCFMCFFSIFSRKFFFANWTFELVCVNATSLEFMSPKFSRICQPWITSLCWTFKKKILPYAITSAQFDEPLYNIVCCIRCECIRMVFHPYGLWLFIYALSTDDFFAMLFRRCYKWIILARYCEYIPHVD